MRMCQNGYILILFKVLPVLSFLNKINNLNHFCLSSITTVPLKMGIGL